MYRRSLAPDSGMIFKWKKEGLRKMWMKNTYISLDILWINNDYKIVHIVESAKTNNTNVLSSPSPAKYVIELPANSVKRNKILKGNTFKNSLPQQ